MTGDDAQRSSSLAAVHILLPVWGYKYIKQMLEFCIPTLLASGNIPSVSKSIKTKFVLLTRKNDSELVKDHPAWVELSRVCETEIRSIDDLITRDNHTAVITLAFHRAIVEAGPARKDICFVFMNSDFLIANGAIKNVVARIAGGSSGVVAGNFQVSAEEAAPLLRRYIDSDNPKFEMSARDFLAFSFGRLHPATVANVVNLGVSHNSSPNRLFWRVDPNTLLGRFFLIHVVAVRPERIDEMPSSSYDYSFIPEMCPSGNVHLVEDSDEYVAIEMQPKGHEASEIRRGSLSTDNFAKSLSQWATAQHRANAARTVCFHAKDIPPAAGVAAEAEQFIAETLQKLTSPPVPYKNHPYWQGSIIAHQERMGRAMTKEEWTIVARPPNLKHRLMKSVLGVPPNVSMFHPFWRKYRIISRHLQSRGKARGLFVCHDPVVFSEWLLTQDDMRSFQIETLTSLTRSQYLPLVGTADLAVLHLTDATFRLGRTAIARMAAILAPNGKLVVLVDGAGGVSALSSVLDTRLKIMGVDYQTTGKVKRLFDYFFVRLARRVKNPVTLLFWSVPAAVIAFFLNWLPTLKAPRWSATTSATLEMQRMGAEPIPLPDDLEGQVRDLSAGIDAAAALIAAEESREAGQVKNLIAANEVVSRILATRGA